MPKVHLVYVKGKDFENIEAFIVDDNDDKNIGHGCKAAQDYLAVEMREPGVTGQIKTVEFDDL